MPQFRVNFSRVNTTNGSLVVQAKNEREATEKVRKLADGGKFGLLKWRLKDADKAVDDAEIESEEETIDVEDAYPEDE